LVKPKACILRTAGTNCDIETAAAFELSGAEAHRVHINSLISGEVKLERFQVLAIPGGFSYGDDIASGKILANEIKYKLADAMREFAVSGKPVIGICNGFQVLVKMGVLPDENTMEQTTTLTLNDSDKFECRWVFLKKVQSSMSKVQSQKQRNRDKGIRTAECLWTKGLPEMIQLPVAHGEGKFISRDQKVLDSLEKSGQVVLRYADPAGEPVNYPFNPNGSVNNIAGICNKKGNIFGLMPHPERFVYKWQLNKDPQEVNRKPFSWGFQIFKNAVNYCK
jgi:phosphoribosylformylglycinamidine synthase subunit PurQ / glutaminase